MPIPMAVARFNRRFTNRLLWPLVQRTKSFGLLVHRGRTSGREYTTPVNVFEVDGGLIVALTYGREVDWLKNVFAAGGCDILRSGTTTRYGNPRFVDPGAARPAVPAAVRMVLRVLSVDDFVRMDSEL